jgi:HD-like signal output (HDOD) protein
MVAKTWGLPDILVDAILRHHDAEVFSDSDNAAAGVRTLIAINYLAEYLNDTSIRMRDNLQWQAVSERVLDHLGLTAGEFNELKEDISSVLQ